MVDDAQDPAGPDGAAAPPPFDSLAGLRALGDIQRRGLEAANLVVGRLIAQVDQGGPLFGAEPPTHRGDGDGDGSSPPPGGADLSQVFAQYVSLMNSFFGALVGPGAAAPPGHAGTTTTTGVRADPLVLTPVAPGGRSEGELWLHNRSGTEVADVRVHCGDLRRHDGQALPSATVAFDPEHLDVLPDLTSRGVRVIVDVPADCLPGTYRGTVLAANLPHVWIVAELEVQAVP